MLQFFRHLPAALARRSHWMLTGENVRFLGRATFAGLALIGLWLAVQAWPSGLVALDHSETIPLPYVLDVNSADWPALAQLPGIGETLAKRIVASRQADGPFVDQRDLMRVAGIGPKTVERLSKFLPSLSPPQPHEVR